LTPLIDVIFLLLLFFMLSSTFSKFSEVSIGSGGGTGTAENRPDAIMKLDGSSLFFNGSNITSDAIAEQVASVKESGGKTIILIVGRQTVADDLVPVLKALNETDIGVVVARQGQ